MESMICLAFNPTLGNLSLVGCHCNRVLVYLLAMMSATPSWCLLSCLPEQMIVSPELSLCFSVLSIASAIPMIVDCSCSFHGLPVLVFSSESVLTFQNPTPVRHIGVRRSAIGLEMSSRLLSPAVIEPSAWSALFLLPGEVNSFAVTSKKRVSFYGGTSPTPNPLPFALGHGKGHCRVLLAHSKTTQGLPSHFIKTAHVLLLSTQSQFVSFSPNMNVTFLLSTLLNIVFDTPNSLPRQNFNNILPSKFLRHSPYPA